jgi:hypothetical protein
MTVVSRGLILSLLLVLVGPLTTNAATMDGIIAEISVSGALVLFDNDGGHPSSFQFRTGELHVEGVYWLNLRNTHKSPTSVTWMKSVVPVRRPADFESPKPASISPTTCARASGSPQTSSQ